MKCGGSVAFMAASWIVISGCAVEEGRVDVRLAWEGQALMLERNPFLWLRLERTSEGQTRGELIQEIGPIELITDARVNFFEVPNDAPRARCAGSQPSVEQ